MPFDISDLPHLLETVPPGAWVAISTEENRIIAFDLDADKVFASVDEQHETCPLIVRRPTHDRLLFL
jgi:hypothetical protein